MSRNKPAKSNKQIINHAQAVSYSGPLPAPIDLQRYNEIVPGAAERLIKKFEEQTEHRIEIEKQVIKSDIERSRKGQAYGLIVSLFGLGVSLVLGIFGNPWASGIIGTTTLTGLASVFIYGSRTRKSEREAHRQEQTE